MTNWVDPASVKSTKLPVAGFTPLTTLDWPGNLCATVFVPACPWDCYYCHNKALAVAKDIRDWDAIAEVLAERVGFIEGVVFSGGEPTLYDGLADAIRGARKLGLTVALHTCGAFPEKLAALLAEGLVDWVGMDCKAPAEMYDRVTSVAGSAEQFVRSLGVLVASGTPFEIRTTIGNEVANLEVLLGMARDLQQKGVTRWVLQQRREGGLNGGFTMHPPGDLLREWTARITELTGLECGARAD